MKPLTLDIPRPFCFKIGMMEGWDRLSLDGFWLLVMVWIKRTENFGEGKPECLCRVYWTCDCCDLLGWGLILMMVGDLFLYTLHPFHRC